MDDLKVFLKGRTKESRDRFLGVFKDMSKESSPALMKQLEDRLRKLKARIRHTQSREADLKDKLTSVGSAIAEAKDAALSEELVKVLQGWHDELLSMLAKIKYFELESKRTDIFKIKERIKARTSLMNRVIEVADAMEEEEHASTT